MRQNPLFPYYCRRWRLNRAEPRKQQWAEGVAASGSRSEPPTGPRQVHDLALVLNRGVGRFNGARPRISDEIGGICSCHRKLCAQRTHSQPNKRHQKGVHVFGYVNVHESSPCTCVGRRYTRAANNGDATLTSISSCIFFPCLLLLLPFSSPSSPPPPPPHPR